MDRAASDCRPDQQGSPKVPAAELDRSIQEFKSVLEDAGLACPNSAAVDSADRSADQDSCSDEYSELVLIPSIIHVIDQHRAPHFKIFRGQPTGIPL